MVRKREFRGRKGVNITMEPCLKYIIYTYKIVKEIVKVKLTRPINTSKFTSTEQKKKITRAIQLVVFSYAVYLSDGNFGFLWGGGL